MILLRAASPMTLSRAERHRLHQQSRWASARGLIIQSVGSPTPPPYRGKPTRLPHCALQPPLRPAARQSSRLIQRRCFHRRCGSRACCPPRTPANPRWAHCRQGSSSALQSLHGEIVDTMLGLEMRSTGEVMGSIMISPLTAFAKSQLTTMKAHVGTVPSDRRYR